MRAPLARRSMFLLAGMLAFDVLDRLTGSWTVMDSQWMQDFANPMIKRSPLVWLLINLGFWALMTYICIRLLTLLVFSSQGVTTLRLRIMQRVIMVRVAAAAPARHQTLTRRAPPAAELPATKHLQERFYSYLASKVVSIEERGYDRHNTVIRITWEDTTPAARESAWCHRPAGGPA